MAGASNRFAMLSLGAIDDFTRAQTRPESLEVSLLIAKAHYLNGDADAVEKRLHGEARARIPVVAPPVGGADLRVAGQPAPSGEQVVRREPPDGDAMPPADVGDQPRGARQDRGRVRVAPAPRRLPGEARELDADGVGVAAARVPGDVLLPHALDHRRCVDAIVRGHL